MGVVGSRGGGVAEGSRGGVAGEKPILGGLELGDAGEWWSRVESLKPLLDPKSFP